MFKFPVSPWMTTSHPGTFTVSHSKNVEPIETNPTEQLEPEKDSQWFTSRVGSGHQEKAIFEIC